MTDVNLTSLSAIFGVVVAAAATFWSIYEGRGPLKKLERVSAIVKDMTEDAQGRIELQVVQADLARRINFAYRAPRQLFEVVFAWFSRVGGGVFLGIAYLTFVLAAMHSLPRAMGFWSLSGLGGGILYAAIGLALILLAEAALLRRKRSRMSWIEKHGETETDAPTL